MFYLGEFFIRLDSCYLISDIDDKPWQGTNWNDSIQLWYSVQCIHVQSTQIIDSKSSAVYHLKKINVM